MECEQTTFSDLKDSFDLVIYHRNCHDGIASYAVVRKYYKDVLGKEIEGKPCAYEDPVPDVSGKTVLIVDFSFKAAEMEKLTSEAKAFFLLDHHVSAQRELGSHPNCFFDMARSGAMIAWDFFFPDSQAPPLIEYVQDKDLWLWKLDNSRDFNVAMETLSYKPALWDALLVSEDAVPTMVEKGKLFGEYKQFLVENIARQADRFTWKPFPGEKTQQLNVSLINTFTFINEVGEKLGSDEKCDVALLWKYEAKKKSYRFFLRSNKVDTSVIAGIFGGGGHKGASGFYWKESFEKFIETTKLELVEPAVNDSTQQ